MSIFVEPSKNVAIKDKFDVIVCGAGPAGVAAAISSARTGAKTCLIELKGCLGGVWTAGLVSWIIDYQNKNGIMKELSDALIEASGDKRPPNNNSQPFDAEDMKFILEQKCLEARVHIRLHTRVVGAHKEGSSIKYIITESKSGREAWEAKEFIDATGDGDLAYIAGCEYDFANPDNGYTQPMSLMCLLTGIKLKDLMDVCNGFSSDWKKSKKILKEEMLRGGIEPSYTFPALFHIVDDIFLLMANHQYKLSALNADDVTKATLMARKEIQQQVHALKSLGGRWNKLRVAMTAEQIGTREGRRIKGLYQLTIDDLLGGAEFDDAVCKCTFGIDVHSTDPDKNKNISSYKKYQTKPYDIPLRALISKDVDNLMMAGRCISGDFLAHSSYRVTGTAVPMGEAAGYCTGIATQENILQKDLFFDKIYSNRK
jgi:FAD dependent oxidoreductase